MISFEFLNEVIKHHISDALVITDDEGRVEWVNDAFVEMTEYSFNDIKDKKPGDILQGPNTELQSKKILSKAINEKVECCVDITNYTKSGTEYIVQVRLFPLFDEHRNRLKFVSIQKDVTLERLLSEQSIEFGAYQQALDQQAIVSVTDVNGNITHANDKFCEISGYSLDELIGKNHRLINSGKHPRAFFEGMWKTISSGGKWQGNVCNRRKSGEFYWVDTTVVPVRSSNGDILRYVSIRYDITEKIESERVIQYLEARNQALLDYSPVSHKIIDLDFNLQYMNANGFAMLNLPVNDDWYGKSYPFSFFPESAKGLMKTKLSHVLSTQEKLSFESIAQDCNGKEIWLYHTLIPVPKEDKSLDYITVVSAEITSLKEMQEQLQHREKMDAIGELAGGVAHDFNNQLASIMGYTQLAQMSTQDEKLKTYLSKIVGASERSKDLTKQLLTFSRKQNLKVESFDLHVIIDETIELLSHTFDKRIQLQKSLRAKNTYIDADKTSIQNALLNLCINASHAIENGGGITVKTYDVSKDSVFLTRQSESLEDNYICLEVQDSGCGIPKEHIEKIFDPFFTTKPLGKGTGMGLPSVYGSIKQHKGFVEVASVIDKGTSFYIYLPCEHNTKQLVNSPAEILSNQNVSGGFKILVADDEEYLRDLYKDVLQSAGYDVLIAKNGLAAVELFHAHKDEIDLVIIDLSMPIMGGAEAIVRLRELKSDIKVLVVSGYDKDASLKKPDVNSEDYHNFIEKPFDVNQLLFTVSMLLT